MSQDVNLIVICNHIECQYNHENECGKDNLFVNDLECFAQKENEDEE